MPGVTVVLQDRALGEAMGPQAIPEHRRAATAGAEVTPDQVAAVDWVLPLVPPAPVVRREVAVAMAARAGIPMCPAAMAVPVARVATAALLPKAWQGPAALAEREALALQEPQDRVAPGLGLQDQLVEVAAVAVTAVRLPRELQVLVAVAARAEPEEPAVLAGHRTLHPPLVALAVTVESAVRAVQVVGEGLPQPGQVVLAVVAVRRALVETEQMAAVHHPLDPPVELAATAAPGEREAPAGRVAVHHRAHPELTVTGEPVPGEVRAETVRTAQPARRVRVRE